MLDNLLSGFISPSYTSQTKKDYQITTSTSNLYSSTYSPSYQVQIDSPYAGITKKDVATQQPEISAPIRPSLTSPQEAGGKGLTAGGLDLTGIAVIGVIAVVAYGLMKK